MVRKMGFGPSGLEMGKSEAERSIKVVKPMAYGSNGMRMVR